MIVSDYLRAWRQKSALMPERIRTALDWAGLGHGRAATYEKLLREYGNGQRSDEHFFAYHEATEIVDIYDAWNVRVAEFPCIQDRIASVFKKGPVLKEHENANANSNRPRNDAFVYVLGGKLLHTEGVEVLAVDGISRLNIAPPGIYRAIPSDLLVSFQGHLIRIECKRPMSKDSLEERSSEAFHQLFDNLDDAKGIIAIDTSRILRNGGEYLNAPSAEAGAKFLTGALQELLLPVAKCFNHDRFLGLLGFMRAPIVVNATSAILKSDGTPFMFENLSSAVISYLCIKNGKSPNGHLMHDLQNSFRKTTHDIPKAGVPMR
jgi:hypothetical protein